MGKLILENLIPLLFAVFTPVILMFVHRGLQLAANKWHLESVLEYDAKIDELIVKGIKAVEQKSLNSVKSGEAKTPSEDKLQEVIDWVNAKLKADGLPERAGDELANLIESHIFDGIVPKTDVKPEPVTETKPTA